MPGMTDATLEAARGPAPSRWRDHLAWALSLFLLGLAFKLLLIGQCDNSLPFYDQWDGEGAELYIPYLEHQLTVADLFRPHNEHRIFWTRIYDLALLWLNGQWDNRLQIAVNAVFHCAIVAGFGWMMAGLLGKRTWLFIWLPLLLTLALPYAWENTLWGITLQFYCLLVFTLLSIWWLGVCEPRSARWRLGALAAFASLVTMASGFLAAVAVGGMAIVEVLRNRGAWKRQAPTLIVCAAVTLTGLALKVDVPPHQELKAHSLRAFMVALGKFLAWPNYGEAWLAPLNLLPLLLLGWFYVRSREEHRPAEQIVVGLGTWVLLQALASAYARGQNGEPPASRYMDTCSFLLIANCLSILLVFSHYRPRLRFAPVWIAALGIWAVANGLGLWRATDSARKMLASYWYTAQPIRLQATRAFMATDDDHYFTRENRFFIPFPYVPMLVFLLRTPDIRNILPANVRESLKVVPSASGQSGFVTNGCDLATPDPPTEISWGSFGVGGVQATGAFESAPIKKSAFAYLEIPVAGDLGRPGLSLALIDETSGRGTPIFPRHLAGREWRNFYVRAPAHGFKVVARDDSSTGWFAFKAPREMGWLSYWAMKLIKAWRYVLAAGVTCLCWGVCSLYSRKPLGVSDSK